MEFNKELTDVLLEQLKRKYFKLLFVNLTTDRYSPVLVADDEWMGLRENKSYKISEYWEWFVNSSLIHEEDRADLAAFMRTADALQHIVYRRMVGGSWRTVLLEITPTVNYSADNKECVLTVREISHIYAKEYAHIVERIGSTDAMTGLFNKVAFERDISSLGAGSVGIIYADVNALKYTNDHDGHSAGDELIKKFANLLAINFKSWKAYRLSGDEFAVVVENCNVREFISRVLAFRNSMWIAEEYPSASIGFSFGSTVEVKLVLQDAERAMYSDKRVFYNSYPQYERK